MLRFALEFHAYGRREAQIGSVPGAPLALTVATLAVVHHRFARDLITDRAAGASAGISLAHVFSPTMKPGWATNTSRASSVSATAAPRERRGGASQCAARPAARV